MSHWVNDAAERAKEEDEDRARREEAFTEQGWSLWGGLKHQIEQDVRLINQNLDLVKRRLGGTPLRLEPIDHGFQVTKIVFPAVYLRVRYEGEYLSVERDIVPNGRERASTTEREHITFELNDDYELFMRTDKNKKLTISEASEYLLTPLLNSHTTQ